MATKLVSIRFLIRESAKAIDLKDDSSRVLASMCKLQATEDAF